EAQGGFHFGDIEVGHRSWLTLPLQEAVALADFGLALFAEFVDIFEPIKRTVLFRGDLEGAPGKEIVVFVADLAPGAVGSKHYHPGPEFFYVLEGTLAHEPEGDSPHMMKTGAFGSNPNKGIHLIRNQRARAIDFLIAEKGQPIVISVK